MEPEPPDSGQAAHAELREEVRSQFGMFLDEMRAQFLAFGERLQNHEEQTGSKIDALRHELKGDLAVLAAAVRQNSTDIRQNSTDIRQNTEDIRQNTEDIRKNGEDIRALTGHVEGLEGRVERLEGTVERLDGRVERL
jgi:predicted RNase H-like nuclease (RuvC/YqgF family)